MIIVFFTRLFTPHIGGVEKHVLEISRRLLKKGHKIIIFTETLNPRIKIRKSLKLTGLSIIHINSGSENFYKKFRIWKKLWSYKNIMKSADIIHCHDVFFWYLPFRLIYPNKKVFVTFHGYETKFPPAFKTIMLRRLFNFLASGSINIGSYIEKWYGTKPDAISYGAASISTKSKKLIKSKQIRFVFIGRLEEDNGIIIYLKALEKLQKTIDLKIMFIGSGSFSNEAKKFGEVKSLNYPQALTNLYLADFVFASSYLAILDALSQKKLVFAVYTNPLKKDYLKTSPFSKYLILSSSHQDLESKIMYYLANPKNNKDMTDKGFTFARQQTWDRVTNLYLNLWTNKDI